MSNVDLRVELLSPDDLVLDDNVRTKAKPPRELVESINAQGVLVPVLAHKDMLGQIVVTDGQLRVLASREVKCERIPVVVGPPPGSPEARIVEQLTVNSARVKMKTSDVAIAVEQLQLFGMEPQVIARKIGLHRQDIDDYLRIAKSKNTDVVDEEPQLTVSQAAELAELIESPYCTQEVREKVRRDLEDATTTAATVISRLRSSVELERDYALVEKKFRNQGYTTCRKQPGSQDCAFLIDLSDMEDKSLDEVTHEESCPGHVILIAKDWDGRKMCIVGKPGCLEFRSHGHKYCWEKAGMSAAEKKSEAKRRAALEDERLRKQQLNQEWSNAGGHREEFAVSRLVNQPAGILEDMIAFALPQDEYSGWNLTEPFSLLSAAGLIPQQVSPVTWVNTHLTNAKKAFYAGGFEAMLEELRFYPHSDDDRKRAFVVLNQFIKWGYEPLPVEEEFLADYDVDENDSEEE